MIRVRIAPSPTGYFHIGNAQSALYNWLFARKHNGNFFVRIEDTDRVRSSKESEENIIKSLAWLDFAPDGDIIRQSDNVSKHRDMLEKLLSEGKAFYCHHSQEDLDIERKYQENQKEASRHICEHKNTEKGSTIGGIIRLAVDARSDRIISFDDQIRGKVEFRQSLLGDFSIARTVDDPLYNLAVVADDNEMGITHVIRGEDHISNTPKQILIYEALQSIQIPSSNFQIPTFAHLPLILGMDRSKLSKRHSGAATLDYKKDYLPEALVNFLGSLSYTFSKEIISKEEMIAEFELSKVHKSGAVFNVEKLNWINSQYIRNLEIEKFRNLTGISEIPEKALPLITERLEKLSDIQNFGYFWKESNYDSNVLIWKDFSKEEIRTSLEKSKKIISDWDWSSFDKDALRLQFDNLAKELGDRGLVYWPFRVALTGRGKSPDPVEIAAVLRKDIILQRIDTAINKLQ